ncbi:hypothetical protein FB451DRAFT_1565530 [Mycena latifolia]|nr:hypothetical protein FB451DRAFT_1565530 [Mycena latifolia]
MPPQAEQRLACSPVMWSACGLFVTLARTCLTRSSHPSTSGFNIMRASLHVDSATVGKQVLAWDPHLSLRAGESLLREPQSSGD